MPATPVEEERRDQAAEKLVEDIGRLPARPVEPWRAVAGVWREPTGDSPVIRDVVETVRAMVVGVRVQHVTSYKRLDEKFRTNDTLLAAVTTEPKELRVIDAGGARLVYGVAGGDVGYVLAKRGSLLFACTCGSGLLCEHTLAVFWHALPEVMSRVTGISAAEWRRRLQWAVERFAGSVHAKAAILYYLLHAIHEGGVKVRVATVPAPKPSSMAAPGTGLPGPVEVVRRRVLEALRALGLRGLGNGEWPEAIVYALVASADYTDPPVVVHVVGDIGTFKTRGSMLAARMVLLPHIVVECSGCDPRETHHTLYELLESLGVPVDPGEVGGVVRDVVAQEGYYRAKISIPHLVAAGVDAARLAGRLEELGFEVRRVEEPMRLAVLDPAKAQAFEDYRVRYQPTAVGVLRVRDLFDNHVLVVDEGSRNPQALELLLTRLSITDVHESLRIVFITDNIEPFTEAFSDPRLAPLGDRVIRVMTRGVSPPGRYDVRPPRLSYEDLLMARRALDGVTVARALVHAIRGVGYALQYVLVVDDGDYILVDRAQARVNGLDALEGINAVFKAGGRFEYHTVMLARFYAFLAGRSEATLEDAARALRLTVRSRLVVPAETYLEYKEVVAEVEDRVELMLHHLRPVLPRLDALRAEYLAGNWAAAERVARELVEAGLQGRDKLLAFYAALSVVEECLAEKGVPGAGRTLKRLTWAVLAAKGDPTDYRLVPGGYRRKVRRVHGGMG